VSIITIANGVFQCNIEASLGLDDSSLQDFSVNATLVGKDKVSQRSLRTFLCFFFCNMYAKPFETSINKSLNSGQPKSGEVYEWSVSFHTPFINVSRDIFRDAEHFSEFVEAVSTLKPA